MMRIFVDTNIVIDLLCEREPWFEDAAEVFRMGIMGEAEVFCSSLTLATASYLMGRRKMDAADIFESIRRFCEFCTPTAVDTKVVQMALDSAFLDFEDALQCYSAQEAQMDCIVTRNKKDFERADIPVYDLSEFLKLSTDKR